MVGVRVTNAAGPQRGHVLCRLCSFILADERGLQNPGRDLPLHQALPLGRQPRAQNSCREQEFYKEFGLLDI